MAAMRVRVKLDNRFAQFERKMTRACQRALKDAGEAAGRAALAVPDHGYRVNRIVGQIRVSIERTRRGVLVARIQWVDWRAHFFDRGTYRKLGARKGRPRGDGGGHRGVKPMRFSTKAVRAAQRQLVPLIRKHAR